MQIDLYSDYKSPYAYVARTGAYEIEDDFDVTVRWLPYTLDIASYLGDVDNRTDHQWRRVRYSYMDARRIANAQGLPLYGPKKIYDTRLAQTGMLYAQRHGVFRAYNDLVFDLFWRHELDIEDLTSICGLLERAGCDSSSFEGFFLGEGGAEHDRIREEAEKKGVFGVPLFILDDELFWGGDRLPMIRERLVAKGLRPRSR